MKNKGVFLSPELLADNQLGLQQKAVYAVMLSAEADGFVRANSREIGELLGLSAEAVRMNRLILARLGYIERIPKTQSNFRIIKRIGGTMRWVNRYMAVSENLPIDTDLSGTKSTD